MNHINLTNRSANLGGCAVAKGQYYREELRGKLRKAFSEEMKGLGVAYSRTPKVVEQARRQYDRGMALKGAATQAYEKHRKRWVLAEYKKLQLTSWSRRPVLKPDWARTANRTMEQAEKNVFRRYQSRLLKIESITRREVARVRREHAPTRSRKR